MDKILLKNAKDIFNKTVDLLIVGNKISAIGEIHGKIDAQIIDAKGKTLLPGLVDMQVHLRDFAQAYKETVKSGTMAASRGGFTSIACMPNTSPCLDSLEVLNMLSDKVMESATCKVIPIPAMTKDIAGVEVVDYKIYEDYGICAITDDGRGVQDDEVMRKVFIHAKEHNLKLMQHCEVEKISQGAPLHKGEKSDELNVSGQTGLAESEMVKRDINLLREIGGHYHVLHISAKESIEHVRAAKKEGLNVTCEVTPHHLLLCDEDIPGANTHYKMNPPLRGKQDLIALNEALLDGTIDMITTDHAPHTEEEKSFGLEQAPFGIVGLETALALIYTNYVKTKKISMQQLVDFMCIKPIEIFGINNGSLKNGDLADLCLVDLEEPKVVTPDEFTSKGKNTPFTDLELYGWPILTICEGKITYKDENYDF